MNWRPVKENLPAVEYTQKDVRVATDQSAAFFPLVSFSNKDIYSCYSGWILLMVYWWRVGQVIIM